MSIVLDGTNGISDVDGSASTPAIRGTDANTGIFFPAADTIAFAEGGTEVMRIDSSGNVGIGTTSPSSYGLEVKKASGTAGMLVASGSNTGSFAISGTDLYVTNSAAGTAQFWTNGAERMRLTSGGQFMVGTTTDLGRVSVGFPGATTFGAGINNTDTGSAGQTSINFLRNGVSVGTINTTNAATSYNTSSDYRLKENVQPMTGALVKVAQLKPVTYTWKVNGFAGQGFIAHELQDVVPDCVTGEKDAVDADGKPVYQGVDTSFLVATLTAAIQELKAELDAAKARIAVLEAK